MVQRRTRSPQATQSFGVEIAGSLIAGSVVGLFGELGSGKTCLAQGICKGLGVEGRVTSPTFVMINEYLGCVDGREITVYHFDLYRLGRSTELYELGYEEYFFGNGICLIEWAERAGGLLPKEAWRIYLSYVSDHERDVAFCNGADEP